MGKGERDRTGGRATSVALAGLLLLAPTPRGGLPVAVGQAPGEADPRAPLLVPPREVPEPLTPPPPAGPAMDEVLDLIRQQGSVLEGSVLDEIAGPRELPASPDRARRIRLAELLLRSARLLQRVDPEDPERRELCRSMRREALRVLREALEPPSRIPPFPSSDGSDPPRVPSP